MEVETVVVVWGGEEVVDGDGGGGEGGGGEAETVVEAMAVEVAAIRAAVSAEEMELGGERHF